MKTILVVDDEPNIREVLASYLLKEHYLTLEAANGSEALGYMRKQAVDLVILDLMLPDMEGERVCQEIRTFSSVPIMMLTAKVTQSSRIGGFAAGADDYIVKPFDPREVMARIKAVLRRGDDSKLLADVIVYHQGRLVINSLKHEVTCDGQVINLTPSEYKLLLLLAKYPQRNFSREELVDRVLGCDFIGDIRIIDQHIKNLRQKIEPDSRQPQYIITVYGFGYRFGGEVS
ncbi:two component transcriptional regulator, winged helix family protein [Paenibacillus vortex V453]|uniref:Two component transcriptional regulator, winged helix family protein n=1 Tax=Paenibacillus vortex V453 TaxID=715225 RepID=A0A2R9SU66_9BACL|nr:response regulator transcription factor [Paenibacillus vortex]EFU40882.1 two component transcriptional regulator, winged helix family protein [Paenibacillus vortex V453]